MDVDLYYSHAGQCCKWQSNCLWFPVGELGLAD